MSISVAVKMEDVLRIKSKRYINFNYLSTSGTPDEEVDYGSCGSSVNPSTDSDHKWSTSENDSQD